MSEYTIKLEELSYDISLAAPEVNLALSRTGGQGSKGDSVTSATTVNGEIIFTVTRADGTTFEINAGAIDYELKKISDDWEFLRFNGDTVFRYQNNVMMTLTDTGDINVRGDVNATHTFATANTYPAVDSPIWISQDSRVFETSLNNSILFQNGGNITMELTSTGTLNVAGNVNSNDTTL